MKKISTGFILVLILCSVKNPVFSQRRDRQAKLNNTVSATVQKEDLPFQPDKNIFYNVKEYGAMGNSINIDTDAIVLKNVTDFTTLQCGTVPDKKIAKTESTKL